MALQMVNAGSLKHVLLMTEILLHILSNVEESSNAIDKQHEPQNRFNVLQVVCKGVSSW